jgi:hypothetical protein
MNYYVTKLKLVTLDKILDLSIKTALWAKDESSMIRLGIHEVEDKSLNTREIKISNMRKKWRKLSKRTEEILKKRSV